MYHQKINLKNNKTSIRKTVLQKRRTVLLMPEKAFACSCAMLF